MRGLTPEESETLIEFFEEAIVRLPTSESAFTAGAKEIVRLARLAIKEPAKRRARGPKAQP